MYHISNNHARRFLLAHHGLYGPPRFEGKEGMLAFVRQAGCVQYDPVDIIGRSPELVFLARIPGYTPDMLAELLYRDRMLVDHFDKNLGIFPVEDWPRFKRLRAYYGSAGRSRAAIEEARPYILAELRARGPLSSQDFGPQQKVHWYWGPTSRARAALENMYHRGELCVYEKRGAIKVYDLAENCLPQDLLLATDPLPHDSDYHAWAVKRRVRAVGLLWNRASDAWLGIVGFRAPQRVTAFKQLTVSGDLLPVQVDGLKDTLYIAKEDVPLLEQCAQAVDTPPQSALIAPLDSLMWDRRLISALFQLDYTWEIYTPPEKRRFGPYTLPILYGDRLVGRVQPNRDKKAGTLTVDGLWWEPGIKPDRATKQALRAALTRLAELNGVRLAAKL